MPKPKRKPPLPTIERTYHSPVKYNRFLLKVGKEFYIRLQPVPYKYLKGDINRLKMSL